MGGRARGAAHAPGEQRTREKPRQDRPKADQSRSRADRKADRHRQSDPQQPEAAQIAEGPQISQEADQPVRLPALKGHHQNKKERLEGHSPRKDTATAHL